MSMIAKTQKRIKVIWTFQMAIEKTKFLPMNLHRSMRLLHVSLFAVPFMFLYQQAAAQSVLSDTSRVDEVIIHENRLQIPVNKNSRNLEIITQEEIRRLPARTINEVLSHMNGVDLRQRGPFGAQADIGIDGGSFEQTLVLVNGVKVSDPQTGHHNLNLPIPLDAIERIEVLRGPASRIYGINGLTGSVNIVTKSVEDTQVFAHAYGGSSFKKVEEEEGRSGVYYGNGIQIGGHISEESHDHQLYLTKEYSNGQRYNTASDSYRAFYQNQLRLDEANSINLMGGYIYNDFGANGFYAAPGDIESQEVVQTALVSLGSSHRLSEKLYLTPRVSHRFNKDDYRYFRHDLSTARSLHENNVFAVELNGRYHTRVGDIGIGAESRFESIESSNIGDHKRQNHGYYAEFRTEQIRNMILNIGTYVNYNTQYGWQVFPGIDVSYLLSEDWRLVANAGSSQRIPSFTDLYLDQRPGNIGNPLLTSENAWQAEGIVKYGKAGFSAQTGYFYRDVRDFIDWRRASTDVPYQPFNIDNNRIQGFNLSMKYKAQPSGDFGYQIGAGYTYLNPSVVSQEDDLISKYVIENLKHQLNTNINLMFKTWTFTTTNRFIERASSTAYTVSDVRVAYVFKSFSIYADVQNIFDVTYTEAGAVPMPGRWQTIGLRYHYR